MPNKIQENKRNVLENALRGDSNPVATSQMPKVMSKFEISKKKTNILIDKFSKLPFTE